MAIGKFFSCTRSGYYKQNNDRYAVFLKNGIVKFSAFLKNILVYDNLLSEQMMINFFQVIF